MSLNIDLYNKCKRCKNLQKVGMKFENGEVIYNQWCKFNKYIGEMKCNNFEELNSR